MALVKGTNSFADVAEYKSYVGDRIDMASDASDPIIAQALVSATDMLNEMPWTGVAISETQPLAFPRAGTYFDPRIGRRMTMDPVPNRIQMACIELAYHLITNDGINEDTGSVENITVGAIQLNNIQKASRIPLRIKNMVRPILVNAGASSWWRAN